MINTPRQERIGPQVPREAAPSEVMDDGADRVEFELRSNPFCRLGVSVRDTKDVVEARARQLGVVVHEAVPRIEVLVERGDGQRLCIAIDGYERGVARIGLCDLPADEEIVKAPEVADKLSATTASFPHCHTQVS